MVYPELQSIGILFGMAVIGGLLANRFKQPLVIGLLVIGSLIGPHALGLVNNMEMIDLIIEFGTIILMFVIGMEFSIQKLLKLGTKTIIITLFKTGVMFFLGFYIGVLLGLGMATSAAIGVIVSFSSTSLILSVLKQKNMVQKQEVPLLVAILIIEDILAVIALTFFQAMKNTGETTLLQSLEGLIISLIILSIIYLIFAKVAHRLIGWVLKNSNDEMLTFVGLGLCAGFAYLAYLLHLSPSIGAFLAGSIVSTLKNSRSFEHAASPYNTMFTSLFFIATGTLINFANVPENLTLILAILAILIVGMFIAVGLVLRVFANYQGEQAFFASLVMIPIAVFGLIIARTAPSTVDLVTVTSVCMLITAILMSIIIPRYEKVYALFAPKKSSSVSTIANFISSVLGEFENDTTYKRQLGEKSAKLTTIIILSIAGLIGVHKLYTILPPIYGILTLVVAGGGLLVVISYCARLIKESFRLFVKVACYVEAGTRPIKIRQKVLRLAKGLGLLLAGLYLPFILYMLEAPLIATALPLIVVIIGFLSMRKARNAINNATTVFTQVQFPRKSPVATYTKQLHDKTR